MKSQGPVVYSMTGYGTAAAEHALGRLNIELRTVNSRFLDIALRLPDELRTIEPALREALAQRLTRGKVDVRASVHGNASEGFQLRVKPEALHALAQAQQTVIARFPSARPLSVADCLRFPGVLDEPQTNAGQWVSAFRPLIQAAIDALIESRAREGARLAQAIRERAQAMAAVVSRLKPRAPELVAEFGRKLTERLREAVTQAAAGTAVPLDETLARVRQEVATYGMRVDVAEELTRLEIHIEELLRIVEGGGQIGKRLDFLMQELNREANTLGSKAAGLEVTEASVELKLLIEQVREQVQNIE